MDVELVVVVGVLEGDNDDEIELKLLEELEVIELLLEVVEVVDMTDDDGQVTVGATGLSSRSVLIAEVLSDIRIKNRPPGRGSAYNV